MTFHVITYAEMFFDVKAFDWVEEANEHCIFPTFDLAHDFKEDLLDGKGTIGKWSIERFSTSSCLTH